MTSLSSPPLDLRDYFDNVVVIKKNEKRKVRSVVSPVVDKLVEFVSENSNGIFGQRLVHVGSYYQGLKTQKANEFDYNVPILALDIVWDDSGLEPLIWYGFQGIDDEETERNTSRQGLKIVQKSRRMGPSVNSMLLHLNYVETLQKYRNMTFDGELVPYLVKMAFKTLLSDACSGMPEVTMCQQPHGPALMVTISKEFCHPLPHDVTIDFAPVIQSHLHYPNDWGWPCSNTQNWLTADHIESIRSKGVGLVAKENFFWTVSFAEMEKALTQHADKADNECRKKVHRIMKVFFKNQWRHGSSLSTYLLKNAWLLYCEDETEQWKEKDYLYRRFVECTVFFYKKLIDMKLPQYFRRGNNLLDGKNEDEIKITAANIRQFLEEKRFIRIENGRLICMY